MNFGMPPVLKHMTASLVLMLLMTACVTTERGSISSKADDDKALELSIMLARQYIRDRNWDAAKRHLKLALDMDKSSAEVYEAKALVFQNTGEIALAEENYKKALKIDRKYSRGRNNFGAFLYQQRRFEEAAKQLEIVVKDTFYENRPVAFENLGRCYVQLNQLEKAEKVYRRAHLMSRDSVRLSFALAELYFKLEDYPQSQNFYDDYRRLVSRQSPEALWLGIRLATKFEDQDALSSYVLALKNLYPKSQQYLDYKSTFGNESE